MLITCSRGFTVHLFVVYLRADFSLDEIFHKLKYTRNLYVALRSFSAVTTNDKLPSVVSLLYHFLQLWLMNAVFCCRHTQNF